MQDWVSYWDSDHPIYVNARHFDVHYRTIAADIVYHFPRRGYLGKGMVVSLDKFTAVKMYDKVQRRWKEELKELRGRIKKYAYWLTKVKL